MTSPIVNGPPPGGLEVRVAAPDDRELKTRRPMVMWDRTKVIVIIGLVFLLAVAYEKSAVPIMTWADAFREQASSKWWMFALVGVELLRQVHYVISERSEGWHRFWQETFFGGWERRMSKLNPWNRFRLQRAVKTIVFGSLLTLIFSWAWNTSFVETLASAPSRFFSMFFEPMTGSLPLFWLILLYSFMGMFSLVIMYAFFFIGGVDTYKPGDIKTRFSDVWGQDPVLNRVKETVDFLERPAEIEAKGGHVPGGILLWGPPGTGKTLMAEAIAGETGKPYVFVDPSAFIQTFVGVAPMKVLWVYRKLRKLALRHGGVVVFFDEADALGSRGGVGGGGFDNNYGPVASFEAQHRCNGLHYVDERTATNLWHDHLHAHQAAHRTNETGGERKPQPRRIIIAGGGAGGFSGALQALLTQMSGLKKPRGFITRRLRSFLGIKPKQPPKYRILHIFATNQPDALDAAMLRPGRIDRKYKVGYPHASGRRRTFEGYFAKIRNDLTPENIEKLSLVTPYYTGAMIKDIVNESLIVAMREGREVVTWPDVLKAKMLKRYGEADDWRYTELERHQVAIHEACHAVAMYLLQKRHAIDVATIERRGGVGGFVSPVPLEERFGEWRSEIEIDVMTFLASLAGERLFFDGDNSAGVTGDLGSATAIVTRMHAFHGMGETIGSRAVTIPEMSGGASARPSDGVDRQFLETELGRRVEAHLQRLLAQVHDLLDANRWFVCAVAHALEQHLTITGEDIDAIYRGGRGPNVDGAMYRSDWFLREYGTYINAATAAHKDQSPLAVPLPVAVPQPQWGYPGGNGNGNGGWHGPNGNGNGNGHGNGHGGPYEGAAGHPS